MPRAQGVIQVSVPDGTAPLTTAEVGPPLTTAAVGNDILRAVGATLSHSLPTPSPRDVSIHSTFASHSSRNQDEEQQVSFYIQGTLMFLVISLGCIDVIMRQIVAKTLSRFSYMLSFATVLAYCPIYWGVLLSLIKVGYVPMEQIHWVWAGWRNMLASLKQGIFSAPYLKLFLISALGDAVGNGLGYICTPYVSGPVHSLLAQFTIMFTAILSMCLLRKCYSFAQICGLVGVEVAVLIGVYPSLQRGDGEDSASSPFFAFVLACSCFFNALSFIMKEKAFKLYKDSRQVDYLSLEPGSGGEEGREALPAAQDSLNIFVVDSHVSLFQLPLTLLLLPLAQATGQTHGKDVVSFMLEGFSCLGGDISQGLLCGDSAKFTTYYVMVNIVWNWAILLNVKFNGALATFVALKAISPCSAVLFAYVDWPLLHTTPVKPLTWAVFAVIMPFIIFYIWASKQQQKREEQFPSTASCCWPLGTDVEPFAWEGGEIEMTPNSNQVTARGS